jgi:hypothetical protein
MLGDLEGGAVAAWRGPGFSVVSGGVACLAGLAVLVALLPLRSAVRRHLLRPTRELSARLGPGGKASEVLAALDELDVEVDRVRLGKRNDEPVVTFRLRGRPGQDIELVVAELVARPDVADLVTAGAGPA